MGKTTGNLFLGLFPVICLPAVLFAQQTSTQEISPSQAAFPAGYYKESRLSAVDPDLNPDNIRANVTIFGIKGSYKVPNFGIPPTGQRVRVAPGDDAEFADADPSGGQRFTDNGDNTVTDNATGLMWIKDHTLIKAGGYEFTNALIWEPAFAAVGALNEIKYAGHGDWRIPNVKELQTIVDYGLYAPTINRKFFPNTRSEFYWTSSTYAPKTECAWVVSFNTGYSDGDLYPKTQARFVRPVRGP